MQSWKSRQEYLPDYVAASAENVNNSNIADSQKELLDFCDQLYRLVKVEGNADETDSQRLAGLLLDWSSAIIAGGHEDFLRTNGAEISEGLGKIEAINRVLLDRFGEVQKIAKS